MRAGPVKTRVARALSYIGALVLVSLLSWMRLPAHAQGVLWAEDGAVFLSDAMAPDDRWTPFKPYAGYLHFIPRIAAEIVVRAFPVPDYAYAMNFLACAALACIALMTFHCSSSLTTSVWIRGAWAAIPIFVNVGAIETLGNFANLHWYLLWLAPWLLIKPARTRAEAVLLFAAAFATATTEIISVLFTPLFFYRWRNRSLWPAKAGLALGLCAQVYTTVTYPRAPYTQYQLDPASLIYGWPLNTAGPLVYGYARALTQQIVNFGAAPIILAFLIVAVAAAAVFIYGRRQHRRLAMMFLSASILVWIACAAANPAPFLDYARFTDADWIEQFAFTRYSVAATMFVLAIVPVLSSALVRCALWTQPAILVGFSLLLASMYFPPFTTRDSGPAWAEQVAAGAEKCSSGGATAFTAAVAPHYFTGSVEIPCPALEK